MKHFDDLTKINCPFGELDDDTKARLVTAVYVREAGCQVTDCIPSKPQHASGPAFSPNLIYRLKPEPEISDSINWDHVHPDFNYMARDKDKTPYLFGFESVADRDGFWRMRGDVIAKAFGFASYKQGNLPWDKSLIERPNRK